MANYTKKIIIKEVLISTIINALIPFIIYKILLNYLTDFRALMISVVVPLIYNAYQILKNKKPDAYGLFALGGFVLSVAALFISGDEKLLLVRESFVTGIMGLVFLASLLFKRPLIFYFALKFTTPNTAESRQEAEEKWQKSASYRFNVRLMSLVWGAILVLEAATKVAMIYSVSTATFLLVATPTSYLFLGAAVLWNVLYVKRIKRHTAKSN